MKQYCRYCANAFLQGDDFIYCEPKNEMRDKRNCITLNKCKHFELNEMDVFDMDRTYKPRKAYKRKSAQAIDAEQLTIDTGEVQK